MSTAANAGPITPAPFVAKWSRAELSERAASQEHFIDLCRLLGQPTPAEHDATGAEYTFEKGVRPTAGASAGSRGEYGFADVWWRGKFGWEYKRKSKHATLAEAYRQLCQYREALDNPPLLIVCDIARTEIHTNFTGTAKQVHTIELENLPERIGLLRRVFTDPESFRPTITPQRITEDVAEQFGDLAQRLRSRSHDPHDVAHFLMKCVFCLFAEDVGLLPRNLFKHTLERWQDEPAQLSGILHTLFAAMREGGAFGPEPIAHFNGGLFDGSPALELSESEIGVLILAAKQDWSQVEPAVFGTLFERSLDPAKRSQIGAHYTSREDILLIVEPVVMAPLRREWERIAAECDGLLKERSKAQEIVKQRRLKRNERSPQWYTRKINEALDGFLHRLATARVLDPACGSGNFLYVAIQRLLELEKEVITFAARPELRIGLFPHVRPTQLAGIEISPYAAELAQVVIWIGYLQWMRENGFNVPRNPILEPIKSIENRDAILDRSDPDHPAPARWPAANFIIGNPPFLGSKLFRQYGLPDDYIDAMYRTYDLPNTSDLCCYWFERGRQVIAASHGDGPRVGLLATQGIRGGDNRRALERIKRDGDIFMGWADRPWILDGAAVHVSMVGFDGGEETNRTLDGTPVDQIYPNLAGGLDFTNVSPLKSNEDIYQRSPEKGAKFEINWTDARRLLSIPNPNGESSLKVLKPWLNGRTLLQGRRSDWIIDFDDFGSEKEAAQFEAPYELVRDRVRETRQSNRDKRLRQRWWQFRRSGEGVRHASTSHPRLLCTTMVSKHRIFAWIDSHVQPDKTIPVFARSDDYFFGVLHSSVHELWARRMGTQLREAESGFRYTPTSCFETFPLPWPPGDEPAEGSDGHEACQRIGDAAAQLNEQRERWLNPPQWLDPIAQRVDATERFDDVPDDARPLIRESAIMAAAARDPRLKKRTLTNLYNDRPTWLALAHEKLDRATLAAYAATDPAGGWDEDWADVWKDAGAGQPLPDDHPLAERRAEVEQRALGNLLRLNQEWIQSGRDGRNQIDTLGATGWSYDKETSRRHHETTGPKTSKKRSC